MKIAVRQRGQCSCCGYSLEGLGDGGRCPECGAAFGEGVVILWGRGGAELLRQRHPKVELAWFVVFASVSTTMLVVLQMKTPSLPPVYLVIWCVMLGVFAWRVWVLWAGRNGWQARLTKDGYGTRPGVGKVKMTRWREEEVDLRRKEVGRYWFIVRRNMGTPVALDLELADEAAAALREELQRVTGRKVGLEK